MGKNIVGASGDEEAIVSRSLQEEVYRRLRRLIFNRSLDEGSLKLRELAERFQVSPMPVREALRRLEAEGLVTFTRNRSIIISPLSSEEVEGLFEVRLRLEPFAGCKAASRLTAEDLSELESIRGRLEDFSDTDRWRADNAEFHGIINRACGISRLAPIIDNLWLAVEPYRQYYIRDRQLLEVAQDQHRKIVEALKKRDGDEVERILERHLTDTLDTILAGMADAARATVE